ncbi:MAG: MalY/PatB family protein [Christensenella sp.]|uniref:MalY/PatB family protein n=1 Tax=Christensenella sp. TaxID=1935934 RepID=UPI002B21BA97|nr:MalY/PatB family protein [Christensenella sp.]MEA5002282.1 MalY/PatB family protein [Christensenella sp.]
MKYDFTTCVLRDTGHSVKWAEMKKKNPNVQKGIVPLSVADMEFVTAPEIVAGLQDYIKKEALGYTQATDAYFDAVMGWMKKRHGWDVEREWIVPAPGVVAALGIAVSALTQPGDGVIIMTPVYYPFYLVVRHTGRILQENALMETEQGYEIDFIDLEKKLSDPKNKMLILCSPHNPVGRVWTKEELQRIGELCQKHGVLVVVDEIHNDLIMPGYLHTVFSQVKESFADFSVICTAPSKTFNLAGMQASNILIKNKELREKFEKTKLAAGMFELNALGYEACRIAYTQCEAWLEELIGVIDENRRTVEDFLHKHFPEIRVTRLEGTYLQWLDLRQYGVPHTELERLMTQDAQLFFDEGYIFGKAGEGFERLNLACPRSVLQEALGRLEMVLNK